MTPDWQKFSPAYGNFSILLPGAPALEDHEESLDSQKPPAALHFATAQSPTSTFFCNYWELSYTPSGETDAQVTMAGARDGLIEKYGGKLLSHEESRSDGRYTQTFKATMPNDGLMEGRFFIIGQQDYMLAVARPAEDSDDETRKFFDSFKVSSSNR